MTSSDFARLSTRFNFLFKVYEPSQKGRPKIKKFGAYFHPIMGFDIVRFDGDVKPPKGVSLSDHITSTFSPEAEALARDLVKYIPGVTEAINRVYTLT